MTEETWRQIATKVNVIYILSDIQESLIMDVEKQFKKEGELKFEVKHQVNTIKKASRLMVQTVNKHASIHNDDFAEDAEKLMSIINKELFNERN